MPAIRRSRCSPFPFTLVQRLADIRIWRCSFFSAFRGGSAVRCCGRQGPPRASARGGTGQQAPRGQVSSATSLCERRTQFFWTTSGDLTDHITTNLGRAWHAGFSPQYCLYRQSILERVIDNSPGSEDFVSSRHSRGQARMTALLCSVSREECFQHFVFHSVLLEGGRARAGSSFCGRKRKKRITFSDHLQR